MPKFAVEMVNCPECTAPAEVLDRFVLESTDGPIEHAIVLCILRHRRTLLVEQLIRPPSATPETAPPKTTQASKSCRLPPTSVTPSLIPGAVRRAYGQMQPIDAEPAVPPASTPLQTRHST
jgi:hypothetical protein